MCPMLESQYTMIGLMMQQETLTYNQKMSAYAAQRIQIKEQAKTLGCSWALMIT